MKYSILFMTCIAIGSLTSCRNSNEYRIPAEFEEQEFIWFSWSEYGFLGGPPFNTTILEAVKIIHPHIKIKLFYGPYLNFNREQMARRIYENLISNGIDTTKIELFYNEKPFGAIQDPGPVFLRNENGDLALTDFRYHHPDSRSEEIDRNVARQMNLPIISSPMYSDGGGWQTDGQGTLLLVESVELPHNKGMTKEQIEAEYKRVLGINKVIWFKSGTKEEEWGKFDNGLYGIGTNGHIDEFCRFANENTVILAQVPTADTVGNRFAKESFRRLEENLQVLNNNLTQSGKSFNVIRIPTGPLMTKKVLYKSLSSEEQSWFDDVDTDSVEFYLTTGYMNFVIANDFIVTAKFWKEGLPNEIKKRDEQAKLALQKAFPEKLIFQIDCIPLHHDGAGLHCHSRNQPKKI